MRKTCALCKRYLAEVRDAYGEKIVPGGWCNYHGREAEPRQACPCYVDVAESSADPSNR